MCATGSILRLLERLPVAMQPGDSLVSTISMPKGLVLKPMLWETVERGLDDSSPIRTAGRSSTMTATWRLPSKGRGSPVRNVERITPFVATIAGGWLSTPEAENNAPCSGQ